MMTFIVLALIITAAVFGVVGTVMDRSNEGRNSVLDLISAFDKAAKGEDTTVPDTDSCTDKCSFSEPQCTDSQTSQLCQDTDGDGCKELTAKTCDNSCDSSTGKCT